MKNITTNYIPKEWLALKINACRLALSKLPKTALHIRTIRNVITPVCVVDGHTYTRKTEKGKHFFEQAEKRASMSTNCTNCFGNARYVVI